MTNGQGETSANTVPDSTAMNTEALQKNHAARRNGHKQWARRKIKDADNILKRTVIEPESLQQIAVIKASLVNKIDILRELDSLIQAAFSPEKVSSDVIESSDLEDEIKLSIIKIDNYIKDNNRVKVYPTLPKIQLPTFHGEISEFARWYELYDSVVHTNPDISGIQKFTYCLSLLKGRALEAIAGIETSAETYEVMIQTLRNRFSKPKITKDRHLNALLNLSPCKNDNYTRLRTHHDLIQGHINSLKACGLNLSHYEDVIIPVIVRSLPYKLQYKITERLEEDNTLKTVLDYLLHDIEVQERLDSIADRNKSETSNQDRSSLRSSHNKFSPRTTGEDFRHPRSSAVFTVDRQQRCDYCGASHSSIRCTAVATRQLRVDFLKENKCCFNCLKQHFRSECKNRSCCRVCGARHHTSICGKALHSDTQQNWRPPTHSFGHSAWNSGAPSNTGTVPKTMKPNVTTNTFVSSKTDFKSFQIMLQTAVAFIGHPYKNRSKRVRILFDLGSQNSYVSRTLAKDLGLPILGRETYDINTFGTNISKTVSSEIVEFHLFKNHFSTKINAYTSPLVCNPLQGLYLDRKTFQELSSFDLADPEVLNHRDLPIDLLIGCSDYWSFIREGMIRCKSGPVLTPSKLGDLISGPINTGNNSFKAGENRTCNFVTHRALSDTFPVGEDKRLELLVQDLWAMESIGIMPELEQNLVAERFKQTIKYDDDTGRYQVDLPWKENVFHRLRDHRWMAKRRLDAMLNKLENQKRSEASKAKAEFILAEYQKTFEGQLEAGVIEEVEETVEESGMSTRDNELDKHLNYGVVSYLPHSYVIKPHSTSTVVRVVYEGNAHSGNNDLSLNQCLYTGPVLHTNLISILLRWRFYPIPYVADVQRAFLQITLNPTDRNCTRFLWRKDGNLREPITVYRSTRVLFGLNSSPYLLNATVDFHLSKYQGKYDVVDKLKSSVYIDDIICGAFSDEEAIQDIKDTNYLMSLASMNLKKWNTSSQNVANYLISSDTGKDPTENIKVLGLKWDTVQDTVKCCTENLMDMEDSPVITKRQLLKWVGSLYDPLGFLSPYSIRIKKLFQDTCLTKSSWDTELPEHINKQFFRWKEELPLIPGMDMSRYIFPELDQTYRKGKPRFAIHAFGDASTIGYAAVIYVSARDKSGNFSTRLLLSKARVAPLKRQTIPRLELIAALLVSRLVKAVVGFLSDWEITDTTFYSDSENVLFWIKSECKSWSVFVSHRVKEIHDLNKPNDWRYVKSEENPADLATRGMSVAELINSRNWWEGPAWLIDTAMSVENDKTFSDENMPECCRVELRKQTQINLALTNQASNLANLMKLEDYGTLNRLMGVTVAVLKAAAKFRKVKMDERELRELAECKWLACEQAKHYPDELLYCSRGADPPRPADDKNATAVTKQLGLFLDRGNIIRCRTRLERSNLDYNAKYPALLSVDSHYTRLLSEHCHRTMYHVGANQTLATMRTQYWIPSGKRYIKRVINSCLICRRLKVQAYLPHISPSLPPFRVVEASAFSSVGIDFLGPIYIKTPLTKKSVKTYVALFTCSTSRGIHLEPVTSMDTPHFLMSLRRFIARRGVPHYIQSDNFGTFKRADLELSKFLNPVVIQNFANTNRIKWEYGLDRSPWYQGWVERLVGTVKSAMRKTLSRALLTFEELATVLYEIEAVINSRPLTVVGSNADDMPPITPSQLMCGKSLTTLPPLNCVREEELPLNPQLLEKRLRYIEELQNHWWERWRVEYLSELTQNHFHTRGRVTRSANLPKLDDIVLIKDSKIARSQWRIGRVVKLLHAQDGYLRKVEIKPTVKRKNDKRFSETFFRPIQQVVPLEINQRQNL